MLRITKTVLAAAAVAAVLIFGFALPAQAATGGDSGTTQCGMSYLPVEPDVAPAIPLEESLRGDGLNCGYVEFPDAAMGTTSSDDGYVSVSVNDLLRLQKYSDDAYAYVQQQHSVLIVVFVAAILSFGSFVCMTVLWYRRFSRSLK